MVIPRIGPCVCALWLCVSLQAATSLFQSPSGEAWTPVRGSVTTDDSVRHDNRKSMRIEANGTGNASARSSAIRLIVGKTYEISG
jgi:hypothetical protein